MKVLDKILRRHPAEEAQEEAATEPHVCSHAVIVPRWDRVADIGNEEHASGYLCEICAETFSPEEGRKLQESLAERVHLG